MQISSLLPNQCTGINILQCGQLYLCIEHRQIIDDTFLMQWDSLNVQPKTKNERGREKETHAPSVYKASSLTSI